MLTTAKQALTIGVAEWRLAWRGLALRIAMVVVLLAFGVNIRSAHSVSNWGDDAGISLLTYVTAFIGLLGAFIVVPTYQRDHASRMSPLIWMRPLNGETYVLGKIVGAALVMLTLLIELAILVAAFQITGGGITGMPLVLGVLLAAAPALLLTSIVCVASLTIIRSRVASYAIIMAYCAVLGFFLTQSMAVLWNPWANSLAFNKFYGFFLDFPLLLANRLFYLGIAVMAMAIILIYFPRRERRALRGFSGARGGTAMLTCGCVIGALGLLSFGSATRSVTLSGPVTAPTPAAVAISNYTLNMSLDPDLGTVQGVAQFAINNIGKIPVSRLPLYLNDGLLVTSAAAVTPATGKRQAAVIHPSALFSSVVLPRSLAPRERASMTIRYQGVYKLLRPQYGDDRAGLIGTLSDLSPTPLHQTVIGAGWAILFRDSDWYPWPWTTTIMAQNPPPLGWRNLTIRVLSHSSLVASTRDTTPLGTARIATWQFDGQLPGILLAMTPSSYTRVPVRDGTVYLPTADDTSAGLRYGPYVTALHDLMVFFNRESQPVTVVVTPFVRGQGAVEVRAVVGDGLAVVPVDSLDETPDGAQVSPSLFSPSARYRAALSDLAVAWWNSRLPQIGSRAPTVYGASIDLPGGYVGVADTFIGAGYDPTDMLAGYTGAVIAAHTISQRFYDQEMSLRRAAATYVTQGDQTSQRMLQLQLGQGPLAAPMFALGLTGRLDVSDLTPSLDTLSRVVGPAIVQHVLLNLSSRRQTPNDLTDVVCAITRQTGHSLARMVNQSSIVRTGLAPSIHGC